MAEYPVILMESAAAGILYPRPAWPVTSNDEGDSAQVAFKIFGR
jgi:hypothetical protein